MEMERYNLLSRCTIKRPYVMTKKGGGCDCLPVQEWEGQRTWAASVGVRSDLSSVFYAIVMNGMSEYLYA